MWTILFLTSEAPYCNHTWFLLSIMHDSWNLEYKLDWYGLFLCGVWFNLRSLEVLISSWKVSFLSELLFSISKLYFFGTNWRRGKDILVTLMANLQLFLRGLKLRLLRLQGQTYSYYRVDTSKILLLPSWHLLRHFLNSWMMLVLWKGNKKGNVNISLVSTTAGALYALKHWYIDTNTRLDTDGDM